MLYDYMIQDELERLRQSEQEQDNRLYLELPLCPPNWQPKELEIEEDNESERGVIIIQM